MHLLWLRTNAKSIFYVVMKPILDVESGSYDEVGVFFRRAVRSYCYKVQNPSDSKVIQNNLHSFFFRLNVHGM